MIRMVSFRPKLRMGPFFIYFLGAPMIYIAKSVFLAVNASLRWLTKYINLWKHQEYEIPYVFI